MHTETEKFPVKKKKVPKVEPVENPLEMIETPIGEWDKVKNALLNVRASNRCAILALKPIDAEVSLDELSTIFDFLRDWDQLTLQNILTLYGKRIPMEFAPALHTESKMEIMWLRQWLLASVDPRIGKYPGLPWRSYIRKIIRENYLFAENLLYGDETNFKSLVEAFLSARKKVLCIFPKNWNKAEKSN
jgi:hypothetical protein